MSETNCSESALSDLLCVIDPQPPKGIKYMLGGEAWLSPEDRTPMRLHCEEWGNLGPMELNPDIRPNKSGLRVKSSDFIAPKGAKGFKCIDGVYYWSKKSVYDT